MASFNLGSIKGIKGDTGPKGDRGEKGDVGPEGERGKDGITPVFSIGGVNTVAFSEDANVEIDSSDVANPKIYFSVPKGKDGKDSAGDMIASVYDTNGKKTDFYAYADGLMETVLSKNGGNMQGKLTAFESNTGERCVRNIFFAEALPETAANGDICFVTKKEGQQVLSDHGIGSEVVINEAGEETVYVIADKNFYGDNTVTLIRKYFSDFTEYFDYSGKERYMQSDIDVYLEASFINLFSERIKEKLIPINIENNYKRRCFLPSVSELTAMQYFKNSGITTTTKEGFQREYWMTRDTGQTLNVFAVYKTGEIQTVEQNRMMSLRPMIVLPSGAKTENIVHDGSAAIKLTDRETCIYIFEEGAWKEIDF